VTYSNSREHRRPDANERAFAHMHMATHMSSGGNVRTTLYVCVVIHCGAGVYDGAFSNATAGIHDHAGTDHSPRLYERFVGNLRRWMNRSDELFSLRDQLPDQIKPPPVRADRDDDGVMSDRVQRIDRTEYWKS